MTVEEFYALGLRPENADRPMDLIRGEVVEWSLTDRRHGVVCGLVSHFLGRYARESRRGYGVSGNAGVILSRDPATVIGPDIAYFVGTDPNGEPVTGWADELPVLAVEVHSPYHDLGRTMDKVAEFVRAGVPDVWFIDGGEKTVTVHRPDRLPAVLRVGDTLTAAGLSGFACPVGDYFRLPAERRAG